MGRTTLGTLSHVLTLPLAIAGYYLAIRWAYADLISPNFGYMGYLYGKPSVMDVLVSMACATAAGLALPRRLVRPGDVVLWVLFVLTGAPIMLMAPMTSWIDSPTAWALSATVAVSFVLAVLVSRTPVRLHGLPSNTALFWSVLGLVTVLTYGLLAAVHGLSVGWVPIGDVYDVRGGYSEATAGAAGGLLGYLVFNQANVVNPLLFAVAVNGTRKSMALLPLAGQWVLYSTTGFKTILFSSLALVVVLLVFRLRERPLGLTFLAGGVTVVLTSAVVDAWAQTDSLLTSLLTRRFMLTPGLLTTVYVEFFKDSPKAHLGHSVLAGLVDYPYDQSPPKVIGYWMTGSPDLAANANLFADGYSNFGWYGMLGAGLVLGLYLWALNNVARDLPLRISALVMTMPVVALANSAVLTAMLSHGLFLAVVLLMLAPRARLPLGAGGIPHRNSAVARRQKSSNGATRGGASVVHTA